MKKLLIAGIVLSALIGVGTLFSYATSLDWLQEEKGPVIVKERRGNDLEKLVFSEDREPVRLKEGKVASYVVSGDGGGYDGKYNKSGTYGGKDRFVDTYIFSHIRFDSDNSRWGLYPFGDNDLYAYVASSADEPPLTGWLLQSDNSPASFTLTEYPDPPIYVLYGAGTTDVNGVYEVLDPSGEPRDFFGHVSNPSIQIVFDGKWEIKISEAVVYEAVSTDWYPPLTGWAAVGSGEEPPPFLVALEHEGGTIATPIPNSISINTAGDTLTIAFTSVVGDMVGTTGMTLKRMDESKTFPLGAANWINSTTCEIPITKKVRVNDGPFLRLEYDADPGDFEDDNKILYPFWANVPNVSTVSKKKRYSGEVFF